MPLAPVSKSLWSCCMEALCEYCRIVWDIFPNDKLLRFIVSDSSTQTLNSWSADGQCMSHVSGMFCIYISVIVVNIGNIL